MSQQEKLVEVNQLKTVLAQYRDIIDETQQRMDAMPGLYRDNPDLLVEMMVRANNQIVYMKRNLEKPYFARIDFKEAAAQEPERLYIGKLGVSDLDDHIVTVDWRAPVATLYYDSDVGQVSYKAPQGIVSGELELKRQFEIEKGELLSFRDVDTVANDELLKPYLGVNADNRLKNIVASIQGEQNRVIRESLEKNVIVQGAAGSGKTTVALHRIAYLVYTFRNEIKPEQYLIIGPNQFFISYISSVLPDLDVDSVPETTFEGFAKEYLGEPFTVLDASSQLIRAIKGEKNDGLESFKSSMEYQEAADRFLRIFDRTVVPEKDFELKGIPILEQGPVRELYESLSDSHYSSIQSKVNKCISTLSANILNQQETFLSRVSGYYQDRYAQAETPEELARLHKDRTGLEKELSQGCRKSLKKYFSAVNAKILKLYRTFLETCREYLPEETAALLKKQTLPLLRKRQVCFEDLPFLIYLKERIQGPGIYKEFRHTVIDEAQDMGEFHFYALRRVLSGSTFTIVGDLAQAIYQYRSIHSWDGVISRSFQGRAELIGMEKSYRTTVEIMEAANLVMKRIGLPPAIPVIRHGDAVRVSQVSTEERTTHILNLVRAFEKEGYKSIAIISKTAEESERLNRKLAEAGLESDCIRSVSEQYRGGICTITGYLSKGLEFDCVILEDASEEVYSSERRLDMHLLYVAMTRPLHRLEILYPLEITAPLAEL